MADLLLWWNLVYVLAFFFAFLYAALNAIGLASEGGDIDASADLDHDVDLGADADVDAHLDIDHDVGDLGVEAPEAHVDVGGEFPPDFHVDHDVHVEAAQSAAAAHAGLLNEALSFLGIGKLPLSIILMTFLITFAVVGWAVNLVLGQALPPAVFFPISCAAAVFCGVGGTKLLAATLGRYLRPIESAATPRSALVGKIATAALPVTEAFGQALVSDGYGTLHKVVCRVPKGAEPIPKGQTLLLVRYVRVEQARRRKTGYYLVEPYQIPEA